MRNRKRKGSLFRERDVPYGKGRKKKRASAELTVSRRKGGKDSLLLLGGKKKATVGGKGNPNYAIEGRKKKFVSLRSPR